jgi:hypothetical protein
VRADGDDPVVAAAEALIKEARRRQRRRYALAAGVVIAIAGTVTAALSGTGPSRPPAGGPPPRTSARPRPHKVVSLRQPAQIPQSVNTTLVMWPVVADQSGGIYVDNLRTRHFWQPPAPSMDPGEFQPVLPVGRWIVWSDGAVHEVSAVNPGTPRLIGKTAEFAPSVTPGHVWLQYGLFGHGQNYVRLVAVPGGQAGPAIDLPPSYEVLAGTKAGLLVQVNYRYLAIWNPGAAPVVLPFSALSYPVAAGPRMIAYDTGCRDVSTAQNLPTYGGMGYPVCKTLRVYDVTTGRLRTFAKPAGTIGWEANRAGDFWSFTDIAPSGRLMAAHAALAPAGRGIARVYLLHLAGPIAAPRPVPSSDAFLLSEMAWSQDSSWLFYQGPRAHLWAYQPATGRVRSSKTPCCNYEVLAPLGGPPG